MIVRSTVLMLGASALDFDLKDGTHISSPTPTLRVWQRGAGHWKIAAMFGLTPDRD